MTTTELHWLSRVLRVTLMVGFATLSLFAQTKQTKMETASPTSKEAKPSTRFTEKDREMVINQLKGSWDRLNQAVAGLSEAQLKFKSAPEKWSIADCVEHLTHAEDFFYKLVTNTVIKSPITPDKENKATDEKFITLVNDRNQKMQAPDPIKPTGKWSTVEETLQELDKRRSRTIEFVKNTNEDLRSHFHAFPGRDPIDGVQWVLLISAHCDRHIAQINEVKTNPNFPKN